MKHISKKLTTLAAAMAIGSMILTGCGMLPGQSKWVDRMNETYSDDTFVYDHPGDLSLSARFDTICLKSEKTEGYYVTVEKDDDQLYSDYMNIRYKDEIEEYTRKYYEDVFECDRYEFMQMMNTGLSPVEPMSIDEYLSKGLKKNCGVILYFEDNAPTDDKMVEIITELLRNDKNITFLQVNVAKEGNGFYQNDCSSYVLWREDDDHIRSLTVDRYQDGERFSEEILIKNSEI